MPKLVQDMLCIQDVPHRRCRFRLVRIGQIFCSKGRWWQKRTARTAMCADAVSTETQWFKGETSVRVLDETRPLLKPAKGLSYEEFMVRAAL